MIRHVCSLLTIALAVSSHATHNNIQRSPCPEVFTYEPLGTNDQPLANRWYGIIKLSTDVTLYALWVNVILDRKADILGNWIGDVTTKDNLNFKIVNEELKLIPGQPKTVRFFIQYNPGNKPELQSILFNGREICNDSRSVVDEIVSTSPNVNEVTTETFYDNSQSQNQQTTTSQPNYYIQTTTGIIKVKNTTQNLQTKNPTQSVAGNQWWPQNKSEHRQQIISTPVKSENKTQSTQSVEPQKTTSQIKGTDLDTSLILNHLNRHWSGENKQPVVDSDKINYQQLRPNDNQLNNLQTTTVKTWGTVSYPLTTEIYNPTARPGISVSYGQSNVANNEQNSEIPDSNYQLSFLPVKQITVPDSTHKKMITVNIQVPTNKQQTKPGETVPIQTINIVQNYNDGRRDEAIKGQQEKLDSYGSTSSQLAKPKDERDVLNVRVQLPSQQHQLSPVPATEILDQDDDDKYSAIGIPIYIQNFKPEETCGKVIKKPPQFLPFGSSTSEGQWPWQAAIYQQQTVHFKYICGGTLVSHRHVITAAHCVTRRKSMRLVNQITLTVYLGKFNLRTSVEGVQVMFVKQISVHPDYNSTTFSRDLAVLEFRDSAKFTPWVMPACLWPEDEISLNSIVGKTGSVVSWGAVSPGVIQTELNLLEMPIVDQETCSSSYNFYERFSSAHTYCARYKDDNELCNGDSGGGMVFRIDNSWYLRGVVSGSATSHMGYHCDSNQYIVFTDVAKFLPWILDHIDD